MGVNLNDCPFFGILFTLAHTLLLCFSEYVGMKLKWILNIRVVAQTTSHRLSGCGKDLWKAIIRHRSQKLFGALGEVGPGCFVCYWGDLYIVQEATIVKIVWVPKLVGGSVKSILAHAQHLMYHSRQEHRIHQLRRCRVVRIMGWTVYTYKLVRDSVDSGRTCTLGTSTVGRTLYCSVDQWEDLCVYWAQAQ